MKEKLKDFIDALFANAPRTQSTLDTKEEFFINASDKFDDYIAQGKDEETAFNLTIASIGDISEVLKSLGAQPSVAQSAAQTAAYTPEEIQKSKKRSALLLSVVPVIIFDEIFNNDTIGVTLMFMMIALATGIIIYNSCTKLKAKQYTSCSPQFNDSLQQDIGDISDKPPKKDRVLVSSTIWLLTSVLYILISFMTGAWYVTWVIFIVAGAVQQFADAAMHTGKKRRRAINGAVWEIIVALYFIVSFSTGAWFITWIIFLVGAAISNIIKVIISD